MEEATARGFLRLAFEARLALADVRMQAGDRGGARRDLERLAKEAAPGEFGLIARKAHAAAVDR